MDFDDIFAKLKEVGGKEAKGDTFEGLKASIDAVPAVEEVTLVSKPGKTDDIRKIDDPVETVLGQSQPLSRKALRKQRTEEWFAMPKVEVTNELKKELSIIKYRQYLDPKRFYKKDKWQIPEHFQMGTIVGGPADYYSRLTRKQRGKGFVDELINDEEANKWFKRTYDQIQGERRSGRRHGGRNGHISKRHQ